MDSSYQISISKVYLIASVWAGPHKVDSVYRGFTPNSWALSATEYASHNTPWNLLHKRVQRSLERSQRKERLKSLTTDVLERDNFLDN